MTEDSEDQVSNDSNEEPPGFDESWNRVQAVKNMKTTIFYGTGDTKSYRVNLYQPRTSSVITIYVDGQKAVRLRHSARIADVEGTSIEVQSEADSSNTIQYKRL